MNHLVSLGALSAAISVLCGAFGAHGLSDSLSPQRLANWQTAAAYQMTHSLAVIGFVLWSKGLRVKRWPALAFIAGIAIFSGSLYLLAVSGMRWLGMITPIGGVLFITGWIGWASEAWNTRA